MNYLTIVGNLGGDARVSEANGRKFVSFNVADNDSYTDENGNRHERVQWVSCIMDGDGGKLLQYLKAGRSVMVVGRTSTRLYSSPKERRMMAGLNLSVIRLELLGSNPDPIPSELITLDGQILKVFKAFFIGQEELKALHIKKQHQAEVSSRRGGRFLIDEHGWVTAAPTTAEENAPDQTAADEQQPK